MKNRYSLFLETFPLFYVASMRIFVCTTSAMVAHSAYIKGAGAEMELAVSLSSGRSGSFLWAVGSTRIRYRFKFKPVVCLTSWWVHIRGKKPNQNTSEGAVSSWNTIRGRRSLSVVVKQWCVQGQSAEDDLIWNWLVMFTDTKNFLTQRIAPAFISWSSYKLICTPQSKQLQSDRYFSNYNKLVS